MKPDRQPLVSVIIPCYNAARWLREAIDSCLAQTHSPVEIIVIDDGSTDDSLAIIQSYGEQIRYESGSNRGGNRARNRGFALSRGKYIQFLDADDLLLPDKLKRQVDFLEKTEADVVYGDWKHLSHLPDGQVILSDMAVSGTQADALESLLSGWWVAPVALLLRREIIVRSGGWDETLRAGQDRDFFIAMALSGANIRYQPGCDSIYRRYGAVTVSTSNRPRWLESHQRILEKTELKLSQANQLTDSYRKAMARSYFKLARNYYDLDRRQYQQLLQKTLDLDPAFKPQESRSYNLAWRWLGFGIAERLASLRRHAGAQHSL